MLVYKILYFYKIKNFILQFLTVIRFLKISLKSNLINVKNVFSSCVNKGSFLGTLFLRNFEVIIVCFIAKFMISAGVKSAGLILNFYYAK